MKKILAFGITLLFLLMTISSANEIYLEKQSFITTFDGKTLYVDIARKRIQEVQPALLSEAVFDVIACPL